jgi:lysozyme family protein
MADFNLAQPFILRNEGGLNQDDGGLTYRGIAEIDNPDWPGWPVVKTVTYQHGLIIPEADSFVNPYYKAKYWTAIQADQINSQQVATYFYDWYVNAGVNAIREVQRLLPDADGAYTVDGIVGPVTLDKINSNGNLLDAMHQARVDYYNRLATNYPDKYGKYLGGWLNRANDLHSSLTV